MTCGAIDDSRSNVERYNDYTNTYLSMEVDVKEDVVTVEVAVDHPMMVQEAHPQTRVIHDPPLITFESIRIVAISTTTKE